MGIIRRETSDESIEPSQYKEKQMSMETSDFPDGAQESMGHITQSSTAPESITTPLSPSLSARPTTLPLQQSSDQHPADARDQRLSISLDSSLTTQASGHDHSLPMTASDLGRRTASMDEMRSVLMGHKQRVIDRLESMGYDPYKGVYVKHRNWLMSEKDKAVRRLEELGLDPNTGAKGQRV